MFVSFLNHIKLYENSQNKFNPILISKCPVPYLHVFFDIYLTYHPYVQLYWVIPKNDRCEKAPIAQNCVKLAFKDDKSYVWDFKLMKLGVWLDISTVMKPISYRQEWNTLLYFIKQNNLVHSRCFFSVLYRNNLICICGRTRRHCLDMDNIKHKYFFLNGCLVFWLFLAAELF